MTGRKPSHPDAPASDDTTNSNPGDQATQAEAADDPEADDLADADEEDGEYEGEDGDEDAEYDEDADEADPDAEEDDDEGEDGDEGDEGEHADEADADTRGQAAKSARPAKSAKAAHAADDDAFEGEFDEVEGLEDLEDVGPVTRVVAIVGRPNVGKSTLFNRLVGARKAIVEDKPGVTRDRLYGVAAWAGERYVVVDTGGIDPTLDDGLPAHIRLQADVAIEEADLVLFVVDAHEGPTSVDHDIAAILRRSGRPLLVVANKADNPARQLSALQAAELGLGDVIPVSAAHGWGAADLCDAIVEALPQEGRGQPQVAHEGMRIAFLGRPNAGKSTLLNALVGAQRVIVDATPGTTRDPIDLPFTWRDKQLVLIDTAGLRRRRQVARAHEKLAAIKSIRTMERTSVVALVVDASLGVTDQDQRIARMAFERGKGVVVVLNKWDLVVHDKKKAHDVLAHTEEALAFLERPDIVKTSTTGQGRDVGQGRSYNLDDLLAACWRTGQALGRHISTSDLNDEVAQAVLDYTPPMHQRRNVKLYFATQAENNPPLIVISANMGRCLAPAYERYLLRRLRVRWDLRGIPIRLVVRARGTGNKSRSAENAGKRSPRAGSAEATPAQARQGGARGAGGPAEATPAKPPRRFGSAKRRAERGVR